VRGSVFLEFFGGICWLFYRFFLGFFEIPVDWLFLKFLKSLDTPSFIGIGFLIIEISEVFCSVIQEFFRFLGCAGSSGTF
jgi:hypothetical protein